MYAVVVTFQIQDGKMADFLPAMTENARTSLAVEPGCRRFDVCTDGDRANEVFLYELYADASAFHAHLESDHFKAFDLQVASLIKDKNVRCYDRVAS